MRPKITLLLTIAFSSIMYGQTIWNGPTMTFSKPNGADWNLEANQDRITSNVWLTRQNNNQIYNIAQESSAVGNCSFSPADTEWALGTTADIGSLTFESFTQVGNCAIGNGTSGIVAQGDLVLHLISDDIYIDIKFTYWGNSGSGGFTYQRSTDPALATDQFDLDKVKVFPNPTSNFLSVNISGQQDIKVFDIYGNIVFKELIADEKIIDVRNLKSGLYFLKINKNKPVKFLKI